MERDRTVIDKLLDKMVSAESYDQLIMLDMMRSLREIADALDSIDRHGVEVVTR